MDFLGLRINCENGVFSVDQRCYADKIQEVLFDCKQYRKDALVNETTVRASRALLGKLLWLSGQTMPQIAFSTANFLTRMKTFSCVDVAELNKLARKVDSQKNRGILKYPNLGNSCSWRLVLFTDASFANCDDSGTQGGYFIFLQTTRALTNHGNCCLLAWRSNKIRRIARSTLAAEALAFIEGLDMAFYLKKLLTETLGIDLPLLCLTDNKSLVESIYSTKSVTDKRLRIDISYIRSALNEDAKSCVKWISTEEQLADSLTKNMNSVKLEEIIYSNILRVDESREEESMNE